MTMTLFYVIMSFTVFAGLVYCARRRTAIRQGSHPSTIVFVLAIIHCCYLNLTPGRYLVVRPSCFECFLDAASAVPLIRMRPATRTTCRRLLTF